MEELDDGTDRIGEDLFGVSIAISCELVLLEIDISKLISDEGDQVADGIRDIHRFEGYASIRDDRHELGEECFLMWSKLLNMSRDILRLRSIAHHLPCDLPFDKASNIPELIEKE